MLAAAGVANLRGTLARNSGSAQAEPAAGDRVCVRVVAEHVNSPQTDMPTRIAYSTTAMTTCVRAVIRMPMTAITSITSTTPVAMATLAYVLDADAPKTASTEGPRTSTPLSVPTANPAIISQPVMKPR